LRRQHKPRSFGASQTVAADRKADHQRHKGTGEGEVNEIHDFPFRIELFGTVMLGKAVSKDSQKGRRPDKGLIKTRPFFRHRDADDRCRDRGDPERARKRSGPSNWAN